MGVTGGLARFCSEISVERLPTEVVDRARFLVLDLVGNIVRARHDAESTAAFLAATRAMGLAAGNAGVFGDSARYTPAGAAFLNGALIMLMAGASNSVVETLCADALEHPDRRDPLITAAKVAQFQRFVREGRPESLDPFFDLYSPCSLFYWYQNPLEGLPLNLLALKAVSEDLSD